MISEEEALRRILEAVTLLPSRRVALANALDCFAAEEVQATIPLPNFDNSAMDGYAVRAADCAGPATLRVVGEQPAGLDRQLHVGAGEAVRIFTGAAVPAGADAIVMQEETSRDGEFVRTNQPVEPAQFVRQRGCDLAVGQKILSKGERLRPALLALLASQGMAEVAVGGRASVSILSTGDELVESGRPVEPGEIYESNSTLLAALAGNAGAHVVQMEHCRDDRAALLQTIRRLTGLNDPSASGAATANARSEGTDVVVLSGGVSVGEHDLVQETLRALGAKIEIWRVAIKPGKPFLFARLGECMIFGLPGNPVSAFVTWLRLVRPAVLKMNGAGEAELSLRTVPATLGVDVSNKGDRRHYLRGRVSDGHFVPVGRQESHALFGLSRADALLRVDCGVEYQAGRIVAVELFD